MPEAESSGIFYKEMLQWNKTQGAGGVQMQITIVELEAYHPFTHVLVNDPTKGYGIFIENMLDATG